MNTVAHSLTLSFDTAYGVRLGARERQEDALVCDFPTGSEAGFAVLADGMGGHSAGDIASKIVVTEVFSELKMRSGSKARLETGLHQALEGAARAANACLGQFVAQRPSAHGMGATLLAPVLIQDRLYWISIGDSPLYLYRNGQLKRLNKLHTLAERRKQARRIDGGAPPELNSQDDQANGLTSALAGRKITEIDCPRSPLRLRYGDVLLAASDGLNSLEDDHVQALLQRHQAASAREICDCLLAAVDDLDDPEQDNVSLCLIKVNPAAQPARTAMQDRPEVERGTDDRAITIIATVTRPSGKRPVEGLDADAN